uniref:ApaG domain-containing protein n=1 Tax=Compsopogon caeruleus TaxID=31354 RepID=A0A7S1XDM1_9RHOD
MEKSLKVAVKAERFGDAARIRDAIEELRMRDPYIRLRQELDEAVQSEEFSRAASIRDAMKWIPPPPPLPKDVVKVATTPGVQGPREGTDVLAESAALELAALTKDSAPNESNTVTNGIRVIARSFFIPAKSSAKDRYYLFGYRIQIINESAETVQLVSRHWRTRAGGVDGEVRGTGVVGKQPVLAEGETFEYTSATPLRDIPTLGSQRVLGHMTGTYRFAAGATGNRWLDIEVGRFYFVLPKPVDEL